MDLPIRPGQPGSDPQGRESTRDLGRQNTRMKGLLSHALFFQELLVDCVRYIPYISDRLSAMEMEMEMERNVVQ